MIIYILAGTFVVMELAVPWLHKRTGYSTWVLRPLVFLVSFVVLTGLAILGGFAFGKI